MKVNQTREILTAIQVNNQSNDVTINCTGTDKTQSQCGTDRTQDPSKTDMPDHRCSSDDTVHTDGVHTTYDRGQGTEKSSQRQVTDERPKSQVPVAFVVCDGEVYQLVSPSELRKSVVKEGERFDLWQRIPVQCCATESTVNSDNGVISDGSDTDFQPENYSDLREDGSDSEWVPTAQNRKKKTGPKGITFLSVDKHDGSKYHCNRCDRILKSKYQALKHICSHSKLKCMHCNKEFETIQGLRIHVGRRHGKSSMKTRQYKCDICGKEYKFLSLYKNHVVRHTESGRFHCVDCSQTFDVYSKWFKHRQEHDDNSFVGTRTQPSQPIKKKKYRKGGYRKYGYIKL